MIGRVTEELRFGAVLGRVDTPQLGEDGEWVAENDPQGREAWASRFFGGSAVYRYTPCTEEFAREKLKRSWRYQHPRPYSLPALAAAPGDVDDAPDFLGDDDDDPTIGEGA